MSENKFYNKKTLNLCCKTVLSNIKSDFFYVKENSF